MRGHYAPLVWLLGIFPLLCHDVCAEAMSGSCTRVEKRLSLEIPGGGFGSKRCVSKMKAKTEICPSGGELKNVYVVELLRRNVSGADRPKLELQQGDCVGLTIEGYPADHRGSYPAYFCSSLNWVVLLGADDCKSRD